MDYVSIFFSALLLFLFSGSIFVLIVGFIGTYLSIKERKGEFTFNMQKLMISLFVPVMIITSIALAYFGVV